MRSIMPADAGERGEIEQAREVATAIYRARNHGTNPLVYLKERGVSDPAEAVEVVCIALEGVAAKLKEVGAEREDQRRRADLAAELGQKAEADLLAAEARLARAQEALAPAVEFVGEVEPGMRQSVLAKAIREARAALENEALDE